MPSFLNQGGWVLISILASSFIGWLIIIYKWLVIYSEQRTTSEWPESVLGNMANQDFPAALRICHKHPSILGRVLNKSLGYQGLKRGMFEKQMTRFINAEFLKLKRGLGLVSRLAALSPLLGLLGTVVGLVQTFNVVTAHGTNDPILLADGIGQALLTTQVGLIVSIPLFVLYHVLQSSVNRVESSTRRYVKKVTTIICKA